jgi:hypothetical protein
MDFLVTFNNFQKNIIGRIQKLLMSHKILSKKETEKNHQLPLPAPLIFFTLILMVHYLIKSHHGPPSD